MEIGNEGMRRDRSRRCGGQAAPRLCLALVGLGLAVAAPAAAALAAAAESAGRIGVTAAVNPDASGTPPAAATRVLYVGIDMQADEKVTTAADGRAQLLFLDGSAMSIGPDSEVVLDRFVYDPAADSGELAVTVSRGVLRFVGGRISKRQSVRFDTATATIGIRGGIATIAVGPGGDVQSGLLFGDELTVTSEGVTRRTDMPGTGIDVAAGEPPQPPRVLTGSEVAATLSAFNGRPPAEQERGADADGPAPGASATAAALGEGARRADAAGDTVAGATATDANRQAEAKADAGPDAALVASGVSGSVSDAAPANVAPVTPDSRQAGGSAGAADSPAERGQAAQSAGADSVASGAAEDRAGGGRQAIADLDRIQDADGRPDEEVPAGEVAAPLPDSDLPPAPSAVSGRLLRDPAFDGFDPQTLAVAFLGTNTPPVAGFAVADGRLTARTAGGEVFAFPYRATGADYAVSGDTATGPFPAFAASMFVAADGSFWQVAGATPGVLGDPGVHEFILFGGTPTSLQQIPTAGTVALEVGGLLEPLPFLGGTVPLDTGTGGVAVSPFYLRYGPGIGFAQRQAGATPPVGYQTSLVIAGQGLQQRSFMVGAVATLVEEGQPGSGLPAVSGRVRGSYQQEASQPPLALRASLASVATQTGSAIYGEGGQYLVLNPSALALDAQTGAVTRQTAGMLVRQLDGAATGSDEYFVLSTRPGAQVAADFLAERATRSLKGFTGGIGFAGGASQAGQPFVFVDAGAGADGPGGVRIDTDSATGSVTASALLVNVQGGAARLLSFGDGGNALTAQPASAYIDDRRYIALESPDLPALTSDGQAAKSQDLVLVTAASIDPNLLDLGVQTCKCEYLDWGFWSGALALPDNSEERYHMASWVAGELPDLAAIPVSGTADYAGHLIGSVIADSASYIAAGQMTTSWDFAARAGQFQVENFDAASYAGQLLSADGRAIVGGGLSADQSRAMALSGSFFAGGGDPVAAMGGRFLVQNQQGAVYAAGGSWALDRQ